MTLRDAEHAHHLSGNLVPCKRHFPRKHLLLPCSFLESNSKGHPCCESSLWQEVKIEVILAKQEIIWGWGTELNLGSFSSFSQLYFCSQLQLGERVFTFSLEFMSSYFIINVANRGV